MMAAPYEVIGGAEGVRALVDAFYDVMDTDPEVAPIRAMHNDDLTEARDKFYAFLSGWMGGPPIYLETYGNPMLRRRHFPFPIDGAARDQWMKCMDHALAEVLPEAEHRVWFHERFANVAQHMVNRA
jgi:hemoglobin